MKRIDIIDENNRAINPHGNATISELQDQFNDQMTQLQGQFNN